MTEQPMQISLLLTDTERDFAISAQRALSIQLQRLENTVRDWTPSKWAPQDISDAIQTLNRVGDCLGRRVKDDMVLPSEIPAEDLPLLRLALEVHVEGTILKQEQTASLTHRQEPQTTLQIELDSGLALLQRDPLVSIEAAQPFSLASYLNLETIMRVPGTAAVLEPRVFDEKFHILMSQSLFMKDLRYFREQCSLRNRPVSVAYIDIDDFKKLNTRITETLVDKEVLPQFMSALEASIFGRGYAYREGGDEYQIILPGASHAEAAVFFNSLRVFVEQLSYRILKGDPGPTVSIGVCTAEASTRLTALQIQQFANLAKAHAKKRETKNCVAGYMTGQPQTNESLIYF